MCVPSNQAPVSRKRVIVLISTLGVNRTYRQRQNRAMDVLKARGFSYEVVNGADPEQKERREELFRLSGVKSYPQFFMAEKLGTTSFLGDIGIMKQLKEADELPDSLLDANPSHWTLQRIIGDSKSRKLVVLITGLRIDKDVVERQKSAMEILSASNITFETVDGSDPQMKERREALFKLSGRRGVYPQFFLHDNDAFGEDEAVNYIGDFENFEAVNDASALPQEEIDGNPTVKTWEAIMGSRIVEEVGSGMGHF